MRLLGADKGGVSMENALLGGFNYMGASKNCGTPKWMVYNGKPLKMDDLGVPLFLETPIYVFFFFFGRWSNLTSIDILQLS